MKTVESTNAALNVKNAAHFDEMLTRNEQQLKDVRSFRISLKQWKMFHAVVDFDGFTGAASHLHISQSAISYTLAKLQEQLGVTLLKLEGRKAQLTEEGKILLTRSRELVKRAIEVETLAESLRQGWGPEIRIVVDHNYPLQLLMLAIRKLSPFALNIRLSVEEATMEQAEKALHERTTDLAIGTQVPPGYVGNRLIEIEHVAIAHPDHPLFALNRELTVDDLEKQLQIVISGSHDYMSTHFNSCLPRYSRLWNVRSFDTAIGALRHCLGYAWVPKYRVHRWLDQNQLQVLPLVSGSTYRTNLYLIFGRSVTSDAGVKRFADMLYELSAKGPFEDYLSCS